MHTMEQKINKILDTFDFQFVLSVFILRGWKYTVTPTIEKLKEIARWVLTQAYTHKTWAECGRFLADYDEENDSLELIFIGESKADYE